MTQDDFNKSLLALVMWREARGDGAMGMQAVGCVVRNRVSLGNWSGVITAKWQFSSMSAPGDPQLILYPAPSDPTWRLAMQIAEGVYSGETEDNTGGATHYFATTISVPSWTASMTLTAQIGRQRFYK